jgi:hypothetical protein
MPQPSTLAYVADLVISRVLADANEGTDLIEALEQAYPFDLSVESRRVWLQALVRHALTEKEAAATLSRGEAA